ncbi:hypothetical protein B0T16DRAFT_505210 [Cercophora newfieldiana]|uniref:Uncharacterized protein n=1 Tax=Cercophora newfieldiana TaxID=92897 RepID=A0AA40CXB9_9PEZI|nr:hypothetical protein B0T16DRAFT_505210 [Cercophora newfieldiana]
MGSYHRGRGRRASSPQIKLAQLNKSNDADLVLTFGDGTDDVKVVLEDFHQLHCLNNLRKATWPDYYKESSPQKDDVTRHHLDHCIEILRIALMCFSDVTPITTKFLSKTHAEPDFSTLHTCRNFDKIRDYARAHAEGWAVDD